MSDLKLLMISFFIAFVYYLPFLLLTVGVPTEHDKIIFNEHMRTIEEQRSDCTIKNINYIYSRAHKGETKSRIFAEVVNNKNKDIKFVSLDIEYLENKKAQDFIGKNCFLKTVVNSPHLEYSFSIILKGSYE